MSTSADSTGRFWRCSQCGKHVPARQDTCRCGMARADAGLEIPRPIAPMAPPRGERRSSRWGWGLVAVMLGAMVLLRTTGQETSRNARVIERRQDDRLGGGQSPVVDRDREAAAHSESRSGIVAAEDTPTAQRASILDAARSAAAEIPARPDPSASAAPVIESPTLVTGMDEQRARAAQLFGSRLDNLARKADDLDANFQSYMDDCQRYRTHTYAESRDDSAGGGATPRVGAPYGRDWFVVWTDRSHFEWPIDASCRLLWSEIREKAASVRQELDEIEEAARRSAIIPGVTRDLRRQYRLAFE